MMSAERTDPEDRRARRRRELHQHIFETARRMFLERGFADTTVGQIAAAADIAQATFFNHFPTKEDVLREMAGDVFEHFRSIVEDQLGQDTDTQRRLVGVATKGARLVEQAPELTRSVLLEVLASPTATQTGDGVNGIHDRMAELVRKGQQRGDVRTDHDAEFLAEMLVSSINGTMTRWIHDPTYPLRQRMNDCVVFLAEALRPKEGPSGQGDSPHANGTV